MSTERIDHSIYYHPYISGTDDSIVDTISNLIDQNESIVLYRPRAPIATIPEDSENSSRASTKKKLVLSEGEGSITQVTIFPGHSEKSLIPFYCSQDKTRFALFFNKEVFKNLPALSEWNLHNLCQKKKSEKAYSLINLVEKEANENAKTLSSTQLERITQHINQYLLLDNLKLRKKVFPTRYDKKCAEEITFGPILSIAPLNQLSLYLIKTENVFALIGRAELIAVYAHKTKPKNKIPNENSSKFQEENVEEQIPIQENPDMRNDEQKEVPTNNADSFNPVFSPPSDNKKKRKFEESTIDGTTEENATKFLKTTPQ